MKKRDTYWRNLFLGPALCAFSVFVLWPLIDSFWYSFTNWNGFSSNYRFVGFDNYARVLTDKAFLNATVNSAIWVVAALVLPTLLGLVVALLLNRKFRGVDVFKTIFFLPICLAPIVVGQIWIWIFQPDWGLLNTVIGAATGTASFGFPWLAKPSTALVSVIIAWSWQQTSIAMVIFLAGLTSIPRDLLQAAEIDGVGRWKQMLHIVLPMLRPATVVVVALSIINALKGFDILYIMTGGGPFHSSNTLAFFMYEESFRKYRMGYGSAISVVLFLIILLIMYVYFRQLRKLDKIYD